MTEATTQTRQVTGGSYWLLTDTNGDEWIYDEPGDEGSDAINIFLEKSNAYGDFVMAKEVKLNVNDYWMAYCYYNDEDEFDIDDATECPFNTREHISSYLEMNEAGGHFVWGRIEHIVNGVVVESEDEEVQS